MAEHLAPGDNNPLRVTNAINKNADGLETAQTDIDTLETAVDALEAVTHREVLAANRTYYVRTDGSDSNTGLADTSGGAKLTIAAALTAAAALDCSTYDVTIQVRDGTRTAAVTLPLMLGSGTFSLLGNTTTPANCVISTTSAQAITGTDAGSWTIRGFKLQTTTSGNSLTAIGRTTIRFNTMDFGACAGSHQIFSDSGAKVICSGNYTISGGSAYTHICANTTGYINAGAGRTITITANITFNRFAYAILTGVIETTGNTYSKGAFTVTGSRYSAIGNGVINSYAGGVNYFPGTTVGTLTTGGQYL